MLQQIVVKQVFQTGHTGSQDAIEVYTPQRPYRIYVRANSEKKLWLPKLRETIYLHLVDNDKCDRSNGMETGETMPTGSAPPTWC